MQEIARKERHDYCLARAPATVQLGSAGTVLTLVDSAGDVSAYNAVGPRAQPLAVRWRGRERPEAASPCVLPLPTLLLIFP